MPMKSYNPKDVSIIVGVKAISGFADGTYVLAEMDEDAFSKVSGADGEVARAKSNNYTGKITITLMQSSDSNDYLSGLAIADRVTGTGVVPVTIRDANGTTIVFAESAWVMKIPPVEFGKEIGNREWILDCSQVEQFVGGHVAA
jgi:hypothetical protein